MSCSAPSPLRSVTWTVSPTAAVSVGLVSPSIGSAEADKDHASIDDAGTQGIFQLRRHGVRRRPAGLGGGRERRCRNDSERGRPEEWPLRDYCRRCGGRPGARAQEGDDVVAIGCRTQAGEGHSVPGNQLLGRGERYSSSVFSSQTMLACRIAGE